MVDGFISHASDDAQLALILKEALEVEFDGLNLFCTSDPSATESNKDWLPHILDGLLQANLFIMLITPQSLNRFWLGFEAGFYWHRAASEGADNSILSPEGIFLLTAGVQEPFSPLNRFQSRSMFGKESLEQFLGDLSKYVNLRRNNVIDIDKLKRSAHLLAVFSYATLIRNFEDPIHWRHRDFPVERYECLQDDRIYLEVDHREYGAPLSDWYIGKFEDGLIQTLTVKVYFKGHLETTCPLFVVLPKDPSWRPLKWKYVFPGPAVRSSPNGTELRTFRTTSVEAKIANILAHYHDADPFIDILRTLPDCEIYENG